MFCISHHILENTITSIKYNNTQERRLALFFRRKDFLWKKGPAEMGVFGNAVVFRITVGVRESQRVVVRRGMFSLCKDKPILFACVHSSVKQFSAHKVTQWQNQPPPPPTLFHWSFPSHACFQEPFLRKQIYSLAFVSVWLVQSSLCPEL